MEDTARADSGGRWLTRLEAAEYLRINPLTLGEWRRTRGLPGHRIGARSYRYHTTELDSWVRERGARASAS